MSRDLSRPLPLLHHSHLFSSAVRDILELSLLHEAAGDEITARQLRILQFVAPAGHHIDDVARFLGVTPPAATKAIDQLERCGLVERIASPRDRRLTILACTDRGRRLVARYRALVRERVSDALHDFTDEEVSDLTLLLERYALALLGNDHLRATLCLRCSGWYDRDCALQYRPGGCAWARGDEPT